MEKFKKWCLENQIVIVETKSIPYATQFKITKEGNKLNVNFYTTGKMLLQGKESQLKSDLENYFGIKKIKDAQENLTEAIDLKNVNTWVGVDESGKGDFFGPLVVAACCVAKDQVEQLLKLGIKDSKKLSDSKILRLAVEIEKLLDHSVLVIKPNKYNSIYNRLQNLNHLLAEGHAHCIEECVEKVKIDLIISDQFAKDKNLLFNKLKESSKKIKLVQKFKAEQDIAVACASILARREFVLALKDMESEYAQEFPKGASEKTIRLAQNFADSFGKAMLVNVAKLHFKTLEKIR